MRLKPVLWTAGPILALSAYAVETSFWQHYDAADFENAELKNVALRSDGKLSLAPVFKEIHETPAAYLWAIAQDSKGNLYAGGGAPGSSTAKLFKVDTAGKGSVAADLDGLEIHAIAIDRQDRVYAATSPDGKVFRIAAGGKPEVFYDPKAKYIWAMAFSSQGDLFVATGDKGQIHKVAPSGQGAVFFETDETHARSLAVDAKDNLIAGTEPGGLIIHVSPKAEGFVLYQSSKREVTSVAVSKDGLIYAAAVGNKKSAPLVSPPPAQIPVTPAPAAGGAVTLARTQPIPPPTFASALPSISGGSEVYRINPDRSPRRIWQHASEVVYAIGFDGGGRVLLGTGNKGRIYRLESDRLHTLLVNSSSTQITGFLTASTGAVYTVAANLGRIFQLGPGAEKQGQVESDVLDAGAFSYWGRARYEGEEHGGQVSLETRTGNMDRPQKNWSPWSQVTLGGRTGRIGSPSARFLQYRLKLTAAASGSSPQVSLMEMAYLTKNVAPVVEEIEATPPNYRFPAPSASSSAQTLSLPPMGQKRRSSSSLSLDSGSSLNYARGWAGVRWKAADDNGDKLSYTVEIRAIGEQSWKPLKDNLHEARYSWDTTSFADGEYQVRVTASDAPGNPPAEALKASLESEAFLIDNSAPEISGVSLTAASGGKATLRWKAKDGRSVIEKAEYSVNGGEWLVAQPAGRLADSPELTYEVTLERGQGELSVAIRATDEFENQAVAKASLR